MPPAGRMTLQRALRLAVCESSPEHREALLAALRSQGQAARAFEFTTPEELERAIGANPIDVVVVGQAAPIDLDTVVAVASRHGLNALVALDSLDASMFVRLRESGIADVLIRGATQQCLFSLVDQAELCELRKEIAKAREAMESTDKRVDALLDAVADPLAYLNEGLHVKANQPYLEMLGLETFDDLDGMSLLDFVSKDFSPQVKEKIKKFGREDATSEELEVVLATGKKARLTFSSAHYDGERCLQVSARREAPAITVSVLPSAASAGMAAPGGPPPDMEEWLKKDAPTGLYNRTHFLELLSHRKEDTIAWLVQIEQHDKALAAVGVTKLDALMGSLGKTLQTLLPPGVIVARWTAGTLGLVGAGESAASLNVVGEVREKLAAEFVDVGGKTLSLSIGAGGVVVANGVSADQAVAHMEKALKEALATGQGVRLIDPLAGQKAKAAHDAAKIDLVRTAVEEGRLDVFYQPIIPILDAASGYEALARMRNRSGQLEPTAEFIRLAEECGLSEIIDQHVMRKTIEMAAQKAAQGKRAWVSVKISRPTLIDPKLASNLKQWLEEFSLPVSLLRLEVPVSVASENARETKALRDALEPLGVGLVLSGIPLDASILRLVDVISPSWVKTGKELAENLGGSQEKQAFLKSLVAHAHGQNIQVMAAFIEDAMALATLYSSGVDAAQGLFISAPLATPDFDFSQFG